VQPLRPSACRDGCSSEMRHTRAARPPPFLSPSA
jgi:hypothetical protein